MMDANQNLRLLRGPSVWNRAGWNGQRDDLVWRIALGGLGVALLAAAFGPRRDRLGPLALAGGLLIGCAAEPAAWDAARSWAERRRARQRDVVTSESEASFPASDAPSWTPTTGSVTERPAGGR